MGPVKNEDERAPEIARNEVRTHGKVSSDL